MATATVSRMSRSRFLGLPIQERDEWAARLKDQWDVALDTVVEFNHIDTKIMSVLVYKLTIYGQKYTVRNPDTTDIEAATELLE